MDATLPLSLAAQQLRLTPDAARRLVTRGILSGELRGGRWFVGVADVDRLRADRGRAGDAAKPAESPTAG